MRVPALNEEILMLARQMEDLGVRASPTPGKVPGGKGMTLSVWLHGSGPRSGMWLSQLALTSQSFQVSRSGTTRS